MGGSWASEYPVLTVSLQVQDDTKRAGDEIGRDGMNNHLADIVEMKVMLGSDKAVSISYRACSLL